MLLHFPNRIFEQLDTFQNIYSEWLQYRFVVAGGRNYHTNKPGTIPIRDAQRILEAGGVSRLTVLTADAVILNHKPATAVASIFRPLTQQYRSTFRLIRVCCRQSFAIVTGIE